MNPLEGEDKPETESAAPPSSPSEKQDTSSGPEQPTSEQGSLESSSEGGEAPNQPGNKKDNNDDPEEKKGGIKKLIRKFDIYFLAFIFIIVVSLVISYIALQKNKTEKPVSVATQTLDQNALKQINGNDTQVGGTNQTLDVQSNTVFAGNVLVKNGLQVAGSLKVAGTLSLPGITVSGTTDLGQVNASTLTLTGAETVKGQLTVDQGITVTGIASFSGALNASAINVTSLTVNGDMTYQHHIYSIGGIPKLTQTSALGAGGTSSVNGTDTAGNININTGAGASAGCMVTLTFVNAYATTPYIVITPVGQAAGTSQFYITKNFSSFSVCENNPPSGSSMSFDYQIIG